MVECLARSGPRLAEAEPSGLRCAAAAGAACARRGADCRAATTDTQAAAHHGIRIEAAQAPMTANDVNLGALACAVLQQAVVDAQRGCDRARWFLQSSTDLHVWAHWAGVSVDAVRDAVDYGLLDRRQRRSGRYPSNRRSRRAA